ncbi:MAG: UDP-4-amino-4,6-dideoxy-N-acetyl-beta-L-altrosamine transaminase [Candidatus Omnitrophica bacterium]|nr:UDP-4-amino-4,6-dideoxy-N-acetyl-beta-L-altrosamine transaminase [Candidatus Omnitrophota bacterium]
MNTAFIPYGQQTIDEEDIRSVVDVLRGKWFTQGPKVEEFENSLTKVCGAKYAVAVSSGTAALHLAYKAAGLGRGDEMVTSPITFLATANAALYNGAKPVFTDIDLRTGLIDVNEIKMTKKTKMIVPVHFAGSVCDMASIMTQAQRNGCAVIEDACHALGSEYSVGKKSYKVGSCQHSDMTVFSFHPVKHITTGEGGAITTNNKEFYKKLLVLRSHGIVRDKVKLEKIPWYYEMQELGYNYRITDIQCALGESQLKKLDAFVSRRKEIAAQYKNAFQGLRYISSLEEPESVRSAYHLFVILIDFKGLKLSRAKVMQMFKQNGVGSQVHYIPVYKQPYYQREVHGVKELKNAEKFYEQCLSIPIFPGMSDTDVQKVISAVKGLEE